MPDKPTYHEMVGKIREMETRMESLVRFKKHFTHDFNNIIYTIVGFAEMTVDNLSENRFDRDNIIEILNAAKRAQSLIKQARGFDDTGEQETPENRRSENVPHSDH